MHIERQSALENSGFSSSRMGCSIPLNGARIMCTSCDMMVPNRKIPLWRIQDFPHPAPESVLANGLSYGCCLCSCWRYCCCRCWSCCCSGCGCGSAAHLKRPKPARNAWGQFLFCENHVKMHGGNFVSLGEISWGRFRLGKNYMGAISALK